MAPGLSPLKRARGTVDGAGAAAVRALDPPNQRPKKKLLLCLVATTGLLEACALARILPLGGVLIYTVRCCSTTLASAIRLRPVTAPVAAMSWTMARPFTTSPLVSHVKHPCLAAGVVIQHLPAGLRFTSCRHHAELHYALAWLATAVKEPVTAQRPENEHVLEHDDESA